MFTKSANKLSTVCNKDGKLYHLSVWPNVFQNTYTVHETIPFQISQVGLKVFTGCNKAMPLKHFDEIIKTINGFL